VVSDVAARADDGRLFLSAGGTVKGRSHRLRGAQRTGADARGYTCSVNGPFEILV